MSDIKPNPSIKLPPAQPKAEAKSVEELVPEAKLQSQEEIDRETSAVRLRAEQLKLRRELLELEKLEADIAAIRDKKEKIAMSHDSVEEALKYANQDLAWHQTNCTHMKGGSSESLLGGAPSQGQDSSNFAMIDHTFTSGVRFRMCQRCGKTWFPRDPDYRWAMSRPTKNSPSTGCPSPGLVRNPSNVRLVSEIPHKVESMQEPQFTQGPTGY